MSYTQFKGDLVRLEETHYYPFGLKHGSYYTSATKKVVKKEVGEIQNLLELTDNNLKIKPTADTGYKYKYNGKELQDELGLDWYDLGARNLGSDIGRFYNVDPLTEDYNFQSPYTFANNNPVALIDVNGMGVDTDFIKISTGERTHLEDGKDQVLTINESGMNSMQELYDTDCDAYHKQLSKLEKTNLNLNMTNSQFNDIAGTVYSEASTKGSWKESAAIYSVLQNRADADGDNVINQITKNGIYGYSERNKFIGSNESNLVTSTQKGLAMAIVSGTDYSNGAYFWAGVDIASSVEKRATGGLFFTDIKHDVMNVGSKKKKNAPITLYWVDSNRKKLKIRGSYSYTYESTAGYGKTTFMKKTTNYMSATGENKF
jgi:RHS repeat-associated protein